MNKIRVKLLTSTPDPIEIVYKAARTCYSAIGPLEIDTKEEADMIKLIDRVISAGHHSVLEHVSFSFAVDGISRALTHQLVRHRLASYSQQSQRYVQFKGDKGSSKSTDFITPPSIENDSKAKQTYQETLNKLYNTYLELTEAGIPAEDARFILPNATETKIIMTMNLRELINVSKIRLCEKAQWEIQDLFKAIKEEVSKVNSYLSDQLKPKCFEFQKCTEIQPCGKYNWVQ